MDNDKGGLGMEKIEFSTKRSKEEVGSGLQKSSDKRQQPPKIEVWDGGPIPSWRAEILKTLIGRLVLRKLRQREEAVRRQTLISPNVTELRRHIIHRAGRTVSTIVCNPHIQNETVLRKLRQEVCAKIDSILKIFLPHLEPFSWEKGSMGTTADHGGEMI
jgi:hypothetical protein